MSLELAILDTDMLSEVFKAMDRHVVDRAADYVKAHGSISFSSITHFQVSRGMKAKKAWRQLVQFERFCDHALIVEPSMSILGVAGDLWAAAKTEGHPKDDADLIIAATALHHQRTLVTGNTAHFAWIPGLVLDNWRTA